jgi:DNA modification methylase
LGAQRWQSRRCAERTGARCHAIEIDPLYVEVALWRWDRFSVQAAVRLDG